MLEKVKYVFIILQFCPQILQKPRSHLKILDAWRITYTKLHSEDPQTLPYKIQLLGWPSAQNLCINVAGKSFLINDSISATYILDIFFPFISTYPNNE